MPIEVQTNLNLQAVPSAPAHVVNIKWVEEFFSGKVKAPVRVVETAPIAGSYAAKVFTFTATGQAEIDDENLVDGDRVLLAGQTDGRQNGIYTVTEAGNATTAAELTRASDFDESDKIYSGVRINVDEGTLHANTAWKLSTPDPITLDTTALDFVLTTTATGATKHAEEITGDNVKTSFEIEHNLGTDEVSVEIWNLATKGIVLTDVAIVDDNQVDVSFAKAPAPSQHYRVVVIG